MIPALLMKSAVILLVAMGIGAAMRRWSASSRYVVLLSALSITLLLPLGIFMPATKVNLPFAVVGQASSRATGVAPAIWSFPFVPLWLFGSAILSVRLAMQFRKARRFIHASRPLECGQEYEVRISEGLTTPVAWGLGRKLMLLPEGAAIWDEERRSIVLTHESSHLRRNDCWALLIAELACIVYWLNPLVWFAAARMRREQEHAADDEVLRRGIPASEYAGHLVAIARQGRPSALAAGAADVSDLAIRVKAILDPGRVRTMPTRRMLAFSIVTLCLVALPLASLQAQRRIYKLNDGGIVAPKLIEKNEPNYTDEAKEAKIEGSVLLGAVIDVDGTAQDIVVERGLDDGLDANAVAAIKTWRFQPAQKDGEPVPVSVRIEVNFRLL